MEYMGIDDEEQVWKYCFNEGRKSMKHDIIGLFQDRENDSIGLVCCTLYDIRKLIRKVKT